MAVALGHRQDSNLRTRRVVPSLLPTNWATAARCRSESDKLAFSETLSAQYRTISSSPTQLAACLATWKGGEYGFKELAALPF